MGQVCEVEVGRGQRRAGAGQAGAGRPPARRTAQPAARRHTTDLSPQTREYCSGLVRIAGGT